MAERIFNLDEAEKLLPRLEPLLRVAADGKRRITAIERESARLLESIFLMGGRQVDVERFSQRKREKQQWSERLGQAAQEIEDCGCLLKDLDMGLVDFPCRVGEREVYLCWKLGEPYIQYWHNLDEGFAGRKPIDATLSEELKRSGPV